jgi:hypothetical protein
LAFGVRAPGVTFLAGCVAAAPAAATVDPTAVASSGFRSR